jgi:chemotaxis protein MotB
MDWWIVGIVAVAVGTSGCASQMKDARVKDLERRLEHMEIELEQARTAQREAEDQLAAIEEERQRLVAAQKGLEEQLSQELADAQAKLQMTERGLVLTLLDQILFDAGKSDLRTDGLPVLDKVAAVLKEQLVDEPIAVEGHTDNQPIKFSGWKSNWELSTARATSVIHYFTEQAGIAPERVRAVGYGEFQPVESNELADGRQANRRVEIVILPSKIARHP